MKTKKAKPIKFPSRIILGEGYPWADGIKPSYFEIALMENPLISQRLPMKWPKALWQPDLPKYRLVLEKI